MRDGWTETTLGDIASWSSGKNLSSDKRHETGLIPILGANGIIGRTNEVLLDEELITVGRVGACGETHRSSGPVWISDNALIVIPTEQVTIDLLFYVLSTFNYQSIISGTTQPLITQSKMKSQVVNLPPLNEQKRIVDVVSSVDAYIDALQKQADTARAARNAVLHKLLTAGGDDWTETTLGPLVTLKTGKLDVNAGVEEGEFPFFTCSRDTYKIDVAAYSGKSVIVAGNGDLNVKYYEGEFNAYQRTYILQAINESVLNPVFLFHFMEKYVDTLRNDTQGSTIQYLKKGQFTEAPIVLPPLAKQERIVEIVSSMDDVVQSTEQDVLDAKNLRSGLLSDLLSGEHEIPASYDSLLGAA